VEDLRRPIPMARLLQGDVGSGKTIVALLTMLVASENGFQAALMAPTEILAEQHARRMREILGAGDARPVGLLTGSMPAKERKRLMTSLADGSLRLVVGTHALIQEGVRFHELAVIVIDEQHRFGLTQREKLAAKGEAPDVLVMTATPIPRTLSLALHGDLDVSTIPDRPPGRRPVKTVVREDAARPKILAFLESEIAAGRQAFVVHPVIEETEAADLRAALAGAEALSEALRHRRVGILHGRMKAAEREATMRRFVAGDLDVLVTTTIIEVGIDMRNASVMIVENAERFGLSQLHQLRGRVGRGSHPSWCILLRGARPTEEGARRLSALESTEDGFVLAEADLALRGAGETFGVRQAGLSDLRVADPVRDRDMLLLARAEAEAWLGRLKDPDADPLARRIRARWDRAAERSAVG
jgi:ATP-dependent DNA helicase RecG